MASVASVLAFDTHGDAHLRPVRIGHDAKEARRLAFLRANKAKQPHDSVGSQDGEEALQVDPSDLYASVLTRLQLAGKVALGEDSLSAS